MDSLSNEIICANAFVIANSMIHGDISDDINLTQRDVIDDGSSNADDHGFNQNDNIDFEVTNRLVVAVEDEESFGELVHHGVGSGLNDGSSNAGVSTRMRRRKATQPQRLVYCDLDFNLNEDANLGTIGDGIDNNLLNNDNVDANQYVITMQCDDQRVSSTEISLTSLEPSINEATVTTTTDTTETIETIETIEAIEATDASGGTTKQKNKGFQCEICGSFWNSKTRLKCHYRTHGAAKHLKCEICGKLFGWEYSWKTHMLAHSEQNPNKCPHCGLKLFNKTALTNHIKRIHDNPERPFKCLVCSKSFISKSELNQHSHTHNEDKPFMCEQCGKTFRSKSYMERHYKTHSGIKPFKCEYCGKLLADKTGFTAHIRAHVGERPYMCDVCGKKYTIKRHLTSHMIIHSDLRPFKCEQCGKTFRSRTNFRMHKDSHLGIKRWSCKFCNRTFLSQGNMAKHVRRHIGDRKHKCEVCGKAFIEKQELKNHSKIHINEENKGSKKTVYVQEKSQNEDNHSNNTNEGSISNGDGDTDINSLNMNQYREVMVNGEGVVEDEVVNHNANQQPILAPLQNAMPTVQLPPIHLSMTNSQPLTMNPTYNSMENAHNLDAGTLTYCDFQRSESNRNFYMNHNQGSQSPTSQSSVLSSFFSSQTTMSTSNQHGQYLTDTQQSYLHCSLCSGIFVSVNNLREHLLEFHRVEQDKVLTMMF